MSSAALKHLKTPKLPQSNVPRIAHAEPRRPSSWRFRFGLVTSRQPSSIGALSAATNGRKTDLFI